MELVYNELYGLDVYGIESEMAHLGSIFSGNYRPTPRLESKQ